MAILAAISEALEERDPYTRGHSARVTALTEALAVTLGWREERLSSVRLGGRLHDIGKLAVSDSILRKPGRLTQHELAEVRRHPSAGARLIQGVSAFRPALPYVLYHHERWDGNGYPSGRRGAAIPIEARMLAVADAFDAMTSNRPYRRALPTGEALAEIADCAGTQFDPEIARTFVETWRDRVARWTRQAVS